MAKRRMIAREIAKSKKIAALKSDTARFIYVALLPYTDCQGVVSADPINLATGILSMFPYSAKQIAEALDDLSEKVLVNLYEHPDNGLLMQYERFRDFNTPDKKETPEYPLPENEESVSKTAFNYFREVSEKVLGKVSAEVELEVELEVEVKGEVEGEKNRPLQISAEERADAIIRSGNNPEHQKNRVRQKIRRLNHDFAKRHEADLINWIHHSDERIEAFWEASKPAHWQNTDRAKKARRFNFLDLLNGEFLPPDEQKALDLQSKKSSGADSSKSWTAADMLAHGSLEGNWGNN